MVIAGTVFIKMAPVIQRLYEQMMEPRWVISMGSCANSGGMYDIYSVVQGVDKFLAGRCLRAGLPAAPRCVSGRIVAAAEAVGTERRPLSWVVGPQGVARPPLPSPARSEAGGAAAGHGSAHAGRSLSNARHAALTSDRSDHRRGRSRSSSAQRAVAATADARRNPDAAGSRGDTSHDVCAI